MRHQARSVRPSWPVLLLSVCLVAGVASAQLTLTQVPVSVADHVTSASEGHPAWSVVSAKTLGAGADLLFFQAGYPGISAAYLSGQTERFDVGVKFSFLYGSEASTGVAPGLRLQGLLRFLLGEHGRVKFGLEFEPGLFTYFGRPGGASFGMALPLKFTVGISVLRQLLLHAGFDVPFMLVFVPGFDAAIPLLLGGGLEYFPIPDLSLNFRFRVGPSIVASTGSVGVGLDVLLGVAIRL